MSVYPVSIQASTPIVSAAAQNQYHSPIRVKLWWDDSLIFDGSAPLVNPYHGYVEFGSGSWQYDATTTVDFDWVAYGNHF